MINVAQRWIKQDRDQSKKIKIEIKVKTTTAKTDRREWALLDLSNNVKKAEVVQYFEWPIPVFIRFTPRFIRKNHEYTEYMLL